MWTEEEAQKTLDFPSPSRPSRRQLRRDPHAAAAFNRPETSGRSWGLAAAGTFCGCGSLKPVFYGGIVVEVALLLAAVTCYLSPPGPPGTLGSLSCSGDNCLHPKDSRPPWLTTGWETFDVQAEARNADGLLIARPDSEIKVLTWNVWGEDFERVPRQKALIKEVLNAGPDFAVLHEVSHGFANAIMWDEDLQEIYRFRYSRDPNFRGVLMMYHARPGWKYMTWRTPTVSQGEAWLTAQTPDGQKFLITMRTVTGKKGTRDDETELWQNGLRESGGILCEHHAPAAPLDQDPALANMGLKDAWEETAHDANQASGLTYDMRNPMLQARNGVDGRRTRILATTSVGQDQVSFKAKSTKLLGVDPIPGLTPGGIQVTPSAHYGVEAVFDMEPAR